MKRLSADELLDLPGQPDADVAASLRDVRVVNRCLAGISVTRGHVRRLLRDWPIDRPAEILDLAAGSGDIPRAVMRWARSEGRRLRYTALDVNPAIVRAARNLEGLEDALAWVLGDARAAPFRDDSFDLTTCSMALHHFDPEDAVKVLREMDRVSRLGVVVNDLRRSRIACVLIRILTRTLPANRLTRHDGPVSTLRAYTPGELRDLAAKAGLGGARVRRHAFFRMALVVDKHAGRENE